MSTPYVGTNDYGILTMRQEQIYDAVDDAHSHDFQVGIHANGDVTIDDVLKAYERALQKWPDPDRRHRIEHCTLVNPDLIRRIKHSDACRVTSNERGRTASAKTVSAKAGNVNVFKKNELFDAPVVEPAWPTSSARAVPRHWRDGKMPWVAMMHLTARNGGMFWCAAPPPVAIVVPDPPPVVPGRVIALPAASDTLAGPAL